MGLNNTFAKRVIFDLETCPLPEVAQYLDPPKANRNLKDPEKIKANIEEKTAEQLDGCGLDLDLCSIAAIGWMHEDEAEPNVLHAGTTHEARMIRDFWDALDGRVTIGYNSLWFDLPILLRRSLYLGVQAPSINLDKYRSDQIDLQMKLSLNGTKPFRSLQWYCRRFGVQIPVEDATSGADIAGLVAAGKWSDVVLHCQADVYRTAGLAQKMGLLRAAAYPREEMVL